MSICLTKLDSLKCQEQDHHACRWIVRGDTPRHFSLVFVCVGDFHRVKAAMGVPNVRYDIQHSVMRVQALPALKELLRQLQVDRMPKVVEEDEDDGERAE